MPRYYRCRRAVVVRPKKKWGSNIKGFNIVTAGSQTVQGGTVTLVQNSASTSNPTPVIIKAGNFKVQGDAFGVAGSASGAGLVELSMYVIYLPEGVEPADAAAYQALIAAHPEWVMAWKYVSGNNISPTYSQNSESFSFSSRLKRNLNSGDKVVLLGLANGPSIGSCKFSGMCQYWTSAN